MDDDEKFPLAQPLSHVSADTNTLYTAQNSGSLSGKSPQPKIFLPGQEAVTPATYSGNTMPFGIGSVPADARTFYGSSSPNAPKVEPLGASILYPNTPAAYPNNAQLPPLPPPNKPRISKGALWIALPIGLAIFAIVLALVVVPVSAAWLVNTPTKTAPQTQPTIVAVTPPIPTSIPTPIPTPTVTNAVTTNGFSVTPDHFNVQSDCQPNDQGFDCTVTLALSADADNAASWSASVNGVDANLQSHRGTLQPGEQRQITVSLHDTCPIDASLRVTIKHQHTLKIPLQCNG